MTLALISALGPLSMDLYLPALPQLAVDLGTTDSLAQLTMSACMIGLAAGQIVIGPLSDRVGRRLPLLSGLVAYAALSFACTFAPSVGLLIAARALQGFTGAAGIVLGRAIIRDLFHGGEVARILSLLVLVSGMAPLLAPLLGGQLLQVVDWRGVFVVLAAIGLVLALMSALFLPESLPTGERHAGGLRTVASGFGRVLREPRFTACAIALTLTGVGSFTYISSSSFVFQNQFGLSDEQFSFVFAASSAGGMLCGYLNAALVRRVASARLLYAGITASTVGAVAAFAAAGLGAALWWLLPCVVVTMSAGSFVQPNATAIALSRHRADAGTASAVLGTGPFLAGSTLAPLALLWPDPAVGMTLMIALAMLAAWLVLVFALRPQSLSSR